MTLDTQLSLGGYIHNLLSTNDELKAALGNWDVERLYLAWAKSDAVFPYMVYRIDISPLEPFPMRLGTLYLDLWSDNSSPVEILTIRKRVIELLDELMFTTSEANSVRVSLQTEGFIPESEQGIFHYATQWNLRYYRSSEVAAMISR